MNQVNHSTFAQRGLRAAVTGLLGAGLVATASSAFALNGKGLTYGVYAHDPVLGIDRVGIYGTGNPYVGDTLCKKKLPLLCVNVDGSARPGYTPTGNGPFFEGWVEGHLQATLPVRGFTAVNGGLAAADALCATSFGPGWRMAEFHDGAFVYGMDATNFCNTANCVTPWPAGAAHGGHTMWGYGHLNPAQRYWTHINDQPGNCWD